MNTTATETPPARRDNRGAPLWIDAAKWLPPAPRCVLASDLEAHFIATWDGEEWANAWTDEPIDSVITHWMELPELPEE